MNDMNSTKKRGFAAISPDQHKAICSKGGKTAHEKGTAHEFTSEQAKDAGAKGGDTIFATRGRDYMREIGRKGGLALKAKRSSVETVE